MDPYLDGMREANVWQKLYEVLRKGAQASLEDLNTRLEEPMAMNRFRPNIEVGGAEPWAEDGWQTLTIGGLTFHSVKPCDRCKARAHPIQEPGSVLTIIT